MTENIDPAVALRTTNEAFARLGRALGKASSKAKFAKTVLDELSKTLEKERRRQRQRRLRWALAALIVGNALAWWPL